MDAVALEAALADALSDRYTLERELGRGGMTTVYLARDLKHDRGAHKAPEFRLRVDNATVDRDGGSVYVANANTVRVQRLGAGHYVIAGLWVRTNSGKRRIETVSATSSPPLPGQPRHCFFRFLH